MPLPDSRRLSHGNTVYNISITYVWTC